MGRRRRTWIACGAGLLLAWCAPPPGPPDLDAIASRYIQLVQDLARHDPSLVDHWLTGAPPAATAGREPVATLRARADVLVHDLEVVLPTVSGLQEARARWLAGQSLALRLAARRLLGESEPFDEEARLAFGINPSRVDAAAVAVAREQLEHELPGRAPLAERVAAFRARFQVDAGRRDALMRAALDACREVTRTALRLPEDEAVDVAFVDGLPWDAHARYLGGHRTRIDVNAAAPLDLTRALRLACHEGYAGHHAQHIWMADELVGGRGWLEYALVPGFGPALLVAEGAAEAGADLAAPPLDRARIYLQQLTPAAGLQGLTAADVDRLVRVEQAQAVLEPLIASLAREYLDNRINGATTAERLEHEALVAGAESFVPFIEHRRTRILAYTEGRRLVMERLGATGLAGLHAIFVPPGE